jgi:mannose-6-phosphate isomerase-like protein (cupin superfamily)
MADYTVVNLLEVEDQAPKFGYAPDLESRFARKPLGLERSGLSHFRVAGGYRIPFGHSHSEQEEVYLVVSGSARVKLDDDVVELGEWDAVRIPVGTMRAFEAGPDGAEIIAFGAPDTDNRDIEMTPDWWADQNG